MRVLIRWFFRTLRLVLAPFMLAYAALSKPAAVQRDAEAQKKVDEACRSLTLYYFPTCPFCIKVRKEIHRLALPIRQVNAHGNAEVLQELQQGGGKPQVPCLRIAHDDGSEEWMYESDLIILHLDQRFPA